MLKFRVYADFSGFWPKTTLPARLQPNGRARNHEKVPFFGKNRVLDPPTGQDPDFATFRNPGFPTVNPTVKIEKIDLPREKWPTPRETP